MIRGWVAWIQVTGGGKGSPGSNLGGTICLNVSWSCLATMGTAEVWAGQVVVSSLVAEGAMMVLFLWHLLNSTPVFSGVGGDGVCVDRVVNDSTVGKRVGMNLLSWSRGVWMDRKRSGQFGSWEGGQGLWL